MKQFLVLLAVLPLTLIIMMEFVLNTGINTKVDAINDIVYTAKEIARQDGTFANVIEDLKKDIARIAGVDEIEINASDTYIGEPKPRNRELAEASDSELKDSLIHYRLEVPIKEMKALSSILSKDQQKYIYIIDSYVASEYLALDE